MKTNKKSTPVRMNVYQYLRTRILKGDLHYGERLIETDVAKKFRVSRTPVREAFRKLENEGLIEYSPGRGVTVRKLSDESVLEMYWIRAALEGLAARFAAERITRDELSQLKDLLVEMATSYKRGDFEQTVRLHTRFNDLICRAARSPRLCQMVTRFHEYTERSQMQSFSIPGRFESIHREHKGIVRALSEGDPDRAEEAVKDHIEQARKAYSQTLIPRIRMAP